MDDAAPRLRADAQDNRDRIVAAARTMFAERGLGVGLREVARAAGVGPATLYRRFPTKQDLVDAVFEVELSACRQIVLDGRADPDPWRGFTEVIRRLGTLGARNRGFVDAFIAGGTARGVIADHRRELTQVLGHMARDAQAAGEMRPDFRIQDLTIVLLASRGLSRIEPNSRGAAVDRFAELVIDAFRANR